MSLEWTALVPVLLALALACYIYVVRAQSSTAEYIGKMQALARELNSKAANLDKARETAKESTHAYKRRHQELEALRTETRALRSQWSALRDEVRVAIAERDETRAVAADLRTRLDEATRARARLEKDVAAAQAQHWELVSRLHHDERARVSALNRLRRPPAPLYPSSNDSRDERELSGPSSAAAPEDIALAKSPSESFLLSLQPDLSASDTDSDDDNRVVRSVPRRLALAPAPTLVAPPPARPVPTKRARAPLPPPVERLDAHDARDAVTLLHSPWEDRLPRALQRGASSQSFADVLNAEAGLTPGVVAFRGSAAATDERPPTSRNR